MSHGEQLSERQTTSPLEQQQLIALVELTTSSCEVYGRTSIVLNEFLSTVSIHTDSEDGFMYKIGMGWVENNEPTMAVFRHLYPEVEEADLNELIRIDCASLSAVARVGFNPTDEFYDYDWRKPRQYLFGTDEPLQVLRFASLDPQTQSAPVEQRIRQGMPRELKLMLGAQYASRFGTKATAIDRTKASFNEIWDMFDLSDDEMKTMLYLASSLSSPEKIGAHILQNPRLLSVYAPEGKLDTMAMGGREVAHESLKLVFDNVHNGAEHEHVWHEVSESLGEETIESLFPYQARREHVLAHLQRAPFVPSGTLLEYVSTQESAAAFCEKVSSQLAEDLPDTRKRGLHSYSVAHAAVEFGLDPMPFRLFDLERWQKRISVIDKVAAPGSVESVQSKAWQEQIANIDPVLHKLLSEYVRHRNNPDLGPLPIGGFSGEPGEEELIQGIVESRDRARAGIAEYAELISTYIPPNIHLSEN